MSALLSNQCWTFLTALWRRRKKLHSNLWRKSWATKRTLRMKIKGRKKRFWNFWIQGIWTSARCWMSSSRIKRRISMLRQDFWLYGASQPWYSWLVKIPKIWLFTTRTTFRVTGAVKKIFRQQYGQGLLVLNWGRIYCERGTKRKFLVEF